MMMLKLKDFIRQHALWVGLVAVAIPLLAHLWLQYNSLSQLQATLPYQRKAYMRKYLSSVIEKVITIYDKQAEVALSVPANAFHHKYPNPDFDYNNAIDLEQVQQYFSAHPFDGARRLFVGSISGPTDPNYLIIRFYDPVACSFVGRYGTDRDEYNAAHAAAANWMAMIMTDSQPQSTRPTVDERDPKHRIIVKPVLDEKKRVVGVAGLFLNDDIFLTQYLGPVLRQALPEWFQSEAPDVILTVFNQDDKLVFQNQPFDGTAFEVGWHFPFIYTDWFLGMRMREMTEEEWSRRNFLTSLAVSLLTALVLIGGIVLALRAASRAMKLSQMKADFVSNVSHELRTPLASIRVFGEFLKLGRVRDSHKIQEYGEYIETESRRLTQLINNILDFSKIESGQKTYQFEQTQVETVVSDTLKTFEVVLEQQGFTVQFEKPAQPLPPVVLDHDAIAQAVINLLDNAVKYSREAREISVELGQQGEYATISVRDYGIGIAREDCEKVFEKFYRVGNSLVHDVKGSGLGLSIVKHVVEAHHGKVTVESELGHGSTFTIHLPFENGSRPRPEPKDQGHLLGHEFQVSGETGA